ncbi:MAG TPA: GLPGLI family protein [Flavobacterium sp.]|jgi:GLPGLI family protein|uniref:GLPGLI family protein n=1 Tax=Flavobacterium sp. TaxID=239 RepID=UPI0025BFFA37|nr:GLPGLI family protein [Flavobacterium sp.]MBA4153873.1 GLPGLI family protein [Flavobacterium sp.]HQV35026.1 GLPGLI family protein [Flavobacterium sp.]HQX02914.1 GLPGLI family protein [Flavobacterium sp.]HRZ30936.1 GLPGLI family protein [Flavobacterium sp.]HRZ74778.1 GLPGLI family protein [Flavobacterium sp.]
MKTIIVTLLTLFTAVISAFAQDFQGMAVYESKTSTADFKSNFAGNRDITPEMQKTIEERMKQMFEKTFILNFDKNASIYKEEEKLDAPGQGGGMRMMSNMMGGGGTHYKNVKEKIFTVDKEFFGKEFLVKDTLPKLAWKLEGETKQIGNYTCFKATAVRPVSQSDFKNYRRKTEDKKESDKKEEVKVEGKTETTKTTNLTDGWDVPKEIVVTAWYTPDIPINQGPENYWGLPGLILEVNEGKTIILCSKIVMNTKEKKEIKAPSKGKEVTQAEYDKIVTEKMAEMREMNQGQGGGRTMQYRMGGQ